MFTPKRIKLLIFGVFSSTFWIFIHHFQLDVCPDDESSILGERVASVYWEGYLKYVNHHLKTEHFNEFEKNHPDEYEFKEKKLMILIPKSSTFPKNLTRKGNGFHKVVRFLITFISVHKCNY